jgi:zinc-binding alcohol dehydrogenase family protein
MKAVGLLRSLPIADPESLLDVEAPDPEPGPHDLLVRVEAASINPVDAKQRMRAAVGRVLEAPAILGYDAVGTVITTGAEVVGFEPGDRVFYAGDIGRPGSNAEMQAADFRIAALAPKTLSSVESAALPLTALTAWEAIFDRLRIAESGGAGGALLIIGGAGGVGSIAIQLAKQLTGLRVIATASRPETAEWCRSLGADLVVDHRDLVASLRTAGENSVDHIFNTADTKFHWEAMVELIAPQGSVCAIVGAPGGVELAQLQQKSATFAWEYMFTRPKFATADIARQGEILARVAAMADAGELRSTCQVVLEGLSAETLRDAHARIESGRTIGKIAIRY